MAFLQNNFRHGLFTEQFPVSAYVGSSKDLKDLNDLTGFHDLERGVQKTRDHIGETELNVGSNMWFQLFWIPVATCRNFDLSSEIEVWGPRFEKSRFLLVLF